MGGFCIFGVTMEKANAALRGGEAVPLESTVRAQD